MATRHELNEAEQALKALNAPDDAISDLSRARNLARAQQAVHPLSSEEALNNSRHDVVMAFNDLIQSLQSGLSAPDKIEKAKRAAEDWVKELKAFADVALQRKFQGLRHDRANGAGLR
jgi:hypothetical protein